jgi:photosystem II P680 reaction center D1 protein
MTATLERYESLNIWERFCSWITSLENRLYIGWFGVVMIPTLTATTCFIIALSQLRLLISISVNQ